MKVNAKTHSNQRSQNAVFLAFSLFTHLLSFLSQTESTKNLFTYFASEICPRKERPKNMLLKVLSF